MVSSVAGHKLRLPGGAARFRQQVQQVHSGLELVLAGGFDAVADDGDFAGAALLQRDSHIRLVKLGAEASD